jgi:hypothetical protein
MRKRLHHHLNSMHVYVWLIELGFSIDRSHRIATWWERRVHPIIYRGGKICP